MHYVETLFLLLNQSECQCFTDIDECKDPYICSKGQDSQLRNTKCENLPGSFQCSCSAGYVGSLCDLGEWKDLPICFFITKYTIYIAYKKS